jgi:hypothetical protein
VELPRGQRNQLGFVTGDTFTPCRTWRSRPCWPR